MEFNVKTYIQGYIAECEQSQNFDFEFTEVSGINGLEGIIAGQTAHDNFIAVDSTGDGYVVQNNNGGCFIRRVATIFVMRKYTYADMENMLLQMNRCREQMKAIIRKMIKDENKLRNNSVYLNTNRIAFRELAPEMAGHFTGLYFMLEFEQPYNLQ